MNRHLAGVHDPLGEVDADDVDLTLHVGGLQIVLDERALARVAPPLAADFPPTFT